MGEPTHTEAHLKSTAWAHLRSVFTRVDGAHFALHGHTLTVVRRVVGTLHVSPVRATHARRTPPSTAAPQARYIMRHAVAVVVLVVLLCVATAKRTRRSPQPTKRTWADLDAGNTDIRGPKIYSKVKGREKPPPRDSKIVHVAQASPCAHRDAAWQTTAVDPVVSSWYALTEDSQQLLGVRWGRKRVHPAELQLLPSSLWCFAAQANGLYHRVNGKPTSPAVMPSAVEAGKQLSELAGSSF